MNKIVIAGVAIAVIAAIGGGIYFISSNQNSAGEDDQQSITRSDDTRIGLKTYDACEIFTLESAKQVLGEAAAPSQASIPPATSDDIKVSSCYYGDESSSSASDRNIAGILVRAPLTETGIESNKQAFSGTRPESAQPVSGYGQDAFWNTEAHQLNVLKDNNWIIISNGKSKIENNTLEDAKKVADVLSFN